MNDSLEPELYIHTHIHLETLVLSCFVSGSIVIAPYKKKHECFFLIFFLSMNLVKPNYSGVNEEAIPSPNAHRTEEEKKSSY